MSWRAFRLHARRRWGYNQQSEGKRPARRRAASRVKSEAVYHARRRRAVKILQEIKRRGMCRTRIVCTLGPSTDSEARVRALIHSGMNVARFNFSHGTRDDHARRV